jgi:hypothetical protein
MELLEKLKILKEQRSRSLRLNSADKIFKLIKDFDLEGVVVYSESDKNNLTYNELLNYIEKQDWRNDHITLIFPTEAEFTMFLLKFGEHIPNKPLNC